VIPLVHVAEYTVPNAIFPFQGFVILSYPNYLSNSPCRFFNFRNPIVISCIGPNSTIFYPPLITSYQVFYLIYIVGNFMKNEARKEAGNVYSIIHTFLPERPKEGIRFSRYLSITWINMTDRGHGILGSANQGGKVAQCLPAKCNSPMKHDSLLHASHIVKILAKDTSSTFVI
jgi:hypothetical protein